MKVLTMYSHRNAQDAVLDIQKFLDQFNKSRANLPPFVEPGYDADQAQFPHLACELADDVSIPTRLFKKPVGRLIGDKGNVLGSLYLGPTSLETLMLDIGDLIARHSDSESHDSADVVFSIKNRIHTFVEARLPKPSTRISSPPTEPPLVILEGMIEPYFSKINPDFPIWSRDGFQKIVDSLQQHSSRPEFEWACIVCCNNLILINLTMDSMHSVQQRTSQSGRSGSISSMGSDLIAGFLANAKRAIENLGPLSPSLVNVQALLSLVCIRNERVYLTWGSLQANCLVKHSVL